MNLPNKLTVLRVLMIPLFLVLFYALPGMAGYLAALAVFALAALTDLLDGKLARAHGLITDFGKLMDPLADKLLVMAAMICLLEARMVHPVVVVVILAREFLVTSIRLVAATGGRVLAADGWGKVKTVFQMVWICCGLLLLALQAGAYAAPRAIGILYQALIAAVTVLTVVSGARYTWQSRDLFADM